MLTAEQTLTIVAIFLSPIVAVSITLWYERYKGKRAEKMRCFMSLVAYRDSIPIHANFAIALNTIDIVFHDHSKVLAAWKKYRENLYTDNSVVDLKARNSLKLDLLFEMARSLGYKKWRQTDMDSYYIPIQHYDQAVLNDEIQKELLAYLKNSNKALALAEKKHREVPASMVSSDLDGVVHH